MSQPDHKLDFSRPFGSKEAEVWSSMGIQESPSREDDAKNSLSVGQVRGSYNDFLDEYLSRSSSPNVRTNMEELDYKKRLNLIEATFRERYNFLKNEFEQRITTISGKFEEIYVAVEEDEVLNTLSGDVVSKQFLDKRINEIISESIQTEKEKRIRVLEEKLALKSAELKEQQE